MIQPTLTSALPVSIMPGDPIANGAESNAELADFGAVLALQAATSGVTEGAMPPSTPPIAAQNAIAADPAELVHSGNILPPDLPVAAKVEAPQDQPAVAEILPTPKPQTKAKPGQSEHRPVSRAIKPETAGVVPISEAAKDFDEPAPLTAPVTIPQVPVQTAPPITVKPDNLLADSPVITSISVGSALVSPPIVSTAAEPVAVSRPLVRKLTDGIGAETASKVQGATNRTIPELPRQASDRARAQVERHRLQAPVEGGSAEPAPDLKTVAPVLAVSAKPQVPVLRGSPAAIPTADAPDLAPKQPAALRPAPTEEVRMAVAMPRAINSQASKDELRMRIQADPAMPEPAAAQSATPAQPLAAAASPTSPTPQIRPHDFAALIDRLSAAREALAPQAVSITVAHQEFGPVRLHFRPEEAGLAVAITSPDPDFARAAAAAPAPVLPAAGSEQTGSTPQQRGEESAAQQGGFAQSRGQFSERRESQASRHQHPQTTPQQRGTGRGNAPRQGIFA